MKASATYFDESHGKPLACPLFPTTELDVNMIGDYLAYMNDADVSLIAASSIRVKMFGRPTASDRDIITAALAWATAPVDKVGVARDPGPRFNSMGGRNY